MISMHDREPQARIPFHEMVRIKKADKFDALLGNSADLSCEGICIYCNTPLRPGERYLIDFYLRTDRQFQRIAAEGEVRHCGLSPDLRGHRIGLLFVDLDAEYSHLIHEYISHSSEESWPLVQ